jgi:hypothetical protein
MVIDATLRQQCRGCEQEPTGQSILRALTDAGYSVVRLPERRAIFPWQTGHDSGLRDGWNECLDEIEREE